MKHLSPLHKQFSILLLFPPIFSIAMAIFNWLVLENIRISLLALVPSLFFASYALIFKESIIHTAKSNSLAIALMVLFIPFWCLIPTLSFLFLVAGWKGVILQSVGFFLCSLGFFLVSYQFWQTRFLENQWHNENVAMDLNLGIFDSINRFRWDPAKKGKEEPFVSAVLRLNPLAIRFYPPLNKHRSSDKAMAFYTVLFCLLPVAIALPFVFTAFRSSSLELLRPLIIWTLCSILSIAFMRVFASAVYSYYRIRYYETKLGTSILNAKQIEPYTSG